MEKSRLGAAEFVFSELSWLYNQVKLSFDQINQTGSHNFQRASNKLFIKTANS